MTRAEINAKLAELRATPEYKRVREEFEIVERAHRVEFPYTPDLDCSMMNVDTLLEAVLTAQK